jgi:FKBP12-rapamycin complex-associated protein
VQVGLVVGSPVGALDSSGSLAAFFCAVLHVHNTRFTEAQKALERARWLLGTELSALVGESYERAYTAMVRVQQLTELEEVICYSLLGQQMKRFAGEDGARVAAAGSPNVPAELENRRALMRQMWRERIRGVQRKVEVWQGLLAVRSLVLPMAEESDTWTKFASLLQKSGRTRQSNRTLLQLLGYDPLAIREPTAAGFGSGSGAPNVMLAYLKHLWTTGDSTMRHEAFARIQSLVMELQATVGTGQAVITGWDQLQSSQLVARAYVPLSLPPLRLSLNGTSKAVNLRRSGRNQREIL